MKIQPGVKTEKVMENKTAEKVTFPEAGRRYFHVKGSTFVGSTTGQHSFGKLKPLHAQLI